MSESSGSLFSDQRGRLPKKEALRLANLVLTGEKKRLPVNIIFTDDRRIEKLNRDFRGIAGPTDVLSFDGDRDLGILGEVYISIDTARRQANEFRVTLGEEVLRLVCHGLLHLCGYDHKNSKDSSRMRHREDLYLQKLQTYA
jgi:probable rRNA maturation factor